jgi:hypothetical protein
MAKPGALAQVNLEQIFEKLAAGKPIYPIAKEYGVSHQALYQYLSKHPEYKALRECGIDALLAQREAQLESVPDDATRVAYARARDLLDQARWRAEREVPALWAQSSKITGADGGPIQVRVVRFGETFGETIEGEVVADLPKPDLISGEATRIRPDENKT